MVAQTERFIATLFDSVRSRRADPAVVARPAFAADQCTAIAAPHDSDWVWRPEPWCGPIVLGERIGCPAGGSPLDARVALFHDGPGGDVLLRQRRNANSDAPAPWGLCLEVPDFGGSYVSLAVDLPPEAARGLTGDDLLALDTRLALDRPLQVFARLNIRCGPNTAQAVRALPNCEGHVGVAFDLAYMRFNERRIEEIWVDLIFDAPAMTRILLRDLTFHRRPRAEF